MIRLFDILFEHKDYHKQAILTRKPKTFSTMTRKNQTLQILKSSSKNRFMGLVYSDIKIGEEMRWQLQIGSDIFEIYAYLKYMCPVHIFGCRQEGRWDNSLTYSTEGIAVARFLQMSTDLNRKNNCRHKERMYHASPGGGPIAA